jgi:hypothetical protein
LQNYSKIQINDDAEYIPRDDEAEAARVKDLRGIGEELQYLEPDEVASFNLGDFGLGSIGGNLDDVPR